MYNCIIIDDEKYAIDGISDYLKSFSDFYIKKTYLNSLEALKEISSGEKVDLIFVDIDMPLISGIELANAIRGKTNKLVFTTSHSKYAFDAFEIEADAFLLKPYTLSKFSSTILKLFPKNSDNDDFFFVKNREDGLKLVKVLYQEIIAIESLQNYVRIYTSKENIVAYLSLSELKKKLSDRPVFIQVQRSFIISTFFIKKIDGNTIILDNNIKVIIGNHYKESVLKFIKEKTFKTGLL